MNWTQWMTLSADAEHLVVYAAAAVLCAAESLAFVGLLVPGTALLIGVGGVAAAGAVPMPQLVAVAATGAILGDWVSYGLGKRGAALFRGEGGVLKASYLSRGTQFFTRHGGKSVFLARFVGPLRPVVPFVAGVSHMRRTPFALWSAAGSLCWTAAYLCLGSTAGGVWKAGALPLAGATVVLGLVLGAVAVWRPLLGSAQGALTRFLSWRDRNTTSSRR